MSVASLTLIFAQLYVSICFHLWRSRNSKGQVIVSPSTFFRYRFQPPGQDRDKALFIDSRCVDLAFLQSDLQLRRHFQIFLPLRASNSCIKLFECQFNITSGIPAPLPPVPRPEKTDFYAGEMDTADGEIVPDSVNFHSIVRKNGSSQKYVSSRIRNGYFSKYTL